MNNEKYNQIIDDVYEHYTQTKIVKTDKGEIHTSPSGHYNGITKQEFIDKCKTNPKFSEKWGLKIEERELSTEERNQWFHINWNANNLLMKSDWKFYELDQQNVPTKLITITYKEEKIEVYE